MLLPEFLLYHGWGSDIIILQSYLYPLSNRKENMLPDELLNKYNVLQLLHRGIGGEVWLAEHKALGCKRVLKAIEKSHPQYTMLAREANLLQQCQHSRLVQKGVLQMEELRLCTCLLK